MSHGDDAPGWDLQKIHTAARLMHDALSAARWSKEPTHAEFTPPTLIPALRERCGRILELLETEEIRTMPSDVRRVLFKRMESIRTDVDKAVEARRQFLHPLATERLRREAMFRVEYYIEEAHKKAKQVARELERDRLIRKRRPRQEKPHETCARAVLRAAKWLGPERWCKGWEAVDGRGRRTRFNDPKAHAFSIVGALLAATQALDPDQQFNAFRFVGYAAKCRNTRELQEWNDKLATTHADVRRALFGSIRLMARNGLTWQTEFDL